MALLCFSLSFALLRWTPMRNLLPGHITDAQRVESQTSLLRIDSLSDALARNQAWIANFISVTDTRRQPTDSTRYAALSGAYDPDSLADATPLEKRFVSGMEERERFNISVLAPLDADGMSFAPVASGAVTTAATRKSTESEIIVQGDIPVQAIADGTVLAIFHSPSHGYTVLVQHGRGFVSSISHLGSPLVNSGDPVSCGQPLAFAPAPDSRALRRVMLRIWHNGTPLVPYDILPPEI